MNLILLSLNPCSNGYGLRLWRLLEIAENEKRLNPCSNGYGLRQLKIKTLINRAFARVYLHI